MPETTPELTSPATTDPVWIIFNAVSDATAHEANGPEVSYYVLNALKDAGWLVSHPPRLTTGRLGAVVATSLLCGALTAIFFVVVFSSHLGHR
jgi:hypothetical protein